MRKSLARMMAESKAQTGLEYLFIIAGAVLVVVIVGFVLKGAAQGAGTQVSEQTPQTG